MVLAATVGLAATVADFNCIEFARIAANNGANDFLSCSVTGDPLVTFSSTFFNVGRPFSMSAKNAGAGLGETTAGVVSSVLTCDGGGLDGGGGMGDFLAKFLTYSGGGLDGGLGDFFNRGDAVGGGVDGSCGVKRGGGGGGTVAVGGGGGIVCDSERTSSN